MAHLRLSKRCLNTKPWNRSDKLYLDWFTKREAFIGKAVQTSTFLQEKIEKTAIERPDLPCIKTHEKNYSYSEINDWANQRALFFRELGIGKNDHVGIMSGNSVSYMISIFAALKLNAVPALLNKNLNGEALKHAIITGDIKLLHTDETDLVTENIIRLNLGIPVITENLDAPRDHHRMKNEISFDKSAIPIDRRLPSDKMALIYTSGTTGYPKPAIYSYGANLWAGSLGIMLDWDDSSTVFTGCPMFHTLGSMMSCTGALWNEAAFAFQPTFSASSFIKDAAKFEATTFSYIGEMMRFVANTPETEFDKSHKIKSAFGPGLRPDIWNRMHEKYGNIHFAELYGSSEGIVGLYNIDPDDKGFICRYTPTLQEITQSRLFKYDPENEEIVRHDLSGRAILAGPGENGILCARLHERRPFKGYYKSEKKTNEKILSDMIEPGDSWFNTGDAFTYDEAYCLKFMDRTGDTYRWKGENTSTEEVTNLISHFDFINDVTVYGVEVPGNEGKAGMAAIVGDLTDENLETLVNHLKSNLQQQSVPVFIRKVDKIPKTANFKTRKVELVQDSYKCKNVWIIQKSGIIKMTPEIEDGISKMKL